MLPDVGVFPAVVVGDRERNDHPRRHARPAGPVDVRESSDVLSRTLGLVHLRASQINGCSACVDGGTRGAKKGGETDERLSTVAAWREAPYFTDAERAALALTKAATRLNDRADPVPDEIWKRPPGTRRASAGGPDHHHHHGQRLQPPQRHYPAARRRVGALSGRC